MRSHSEPKSSQPSTATPQQHPSSRAFAPQPQVDSVSPETIAPDLQIQLENAQRLGHSFSKLINSSSNGPTEPPPWLQAKLTLGAPGDRYEQEADQVAQQVVQQLSTSQLQASLGRSSQPQVDSVGSEAVAPDLQTQLENAQRLGHSFSKLLKSAAAQPAPSSPCLQPQFSTSNPQGQVEPDADLTAKQIGVPNTTGLPDRLKAGIESLSGISMASVHVHYNSPKPAQVNALAYAHGSNIHIAAGQERHLPHEAWHVVQQAQGRVRPTLQMQDGVWVNDNAGLENEADVMGAKALSSVVQLSSSQVEQPAGQPLLAATQQDIGATFRPAYADVSLYPIVQMTSYMRALTGDNRVAGEIASLRHEFLAETNRQHQVNTWVDGFAGMPTARFIDNNRHYYSPVGYKLEINNDADVLANYKGDGNTNDIPVTHPRWVVAANALREAVNEIPNYTAWADNQPDDEWGLENMRLPEVNDGTPRMIRDNYVNRFLTPYLQAPLNLPTPEENQARQEGQTSVRDAIKHCGIEALRNHYSQPQGDAAVDRYIGTGREPEGMAAALENAEIPYIESILHAKFNQVTTAWYNRHPGNYAEAAAQANWRSGDPAWLNNRKTSAEAIRNAFNDIGAGNIAVEVIGPEP